MSQDKNKIALDERLEIAEDRVKILESEVKRLEEDKKELTRSIVKLNNILARAAVKYFGEIGE